MKRIFEAPELIIVLFDNDLFTDVMTVSSNDIGGTGDEDDMIDND